MGTSKTLVRPFAKSALRAASLAFAALITASCAGTMKAPPAGIAADRTPSSITRAALRNILMSRMPDLAASRQDIVLAFYKSRDFQPAWTESAKAVEEAKAVLSRAHEHGLRDDDYKLSQAPAQAAPGREAAEYDLALSDAVLRYSRDVRIGRVRPGGLVCVGVPNDYNGFQAAVRAGGSAPWWLAPPHHLNYFDFDSLSGLLSRLGLEIGRAHV